MSPRRRDGAGMGAGASGIHQGMGLGPQYSTIRRAIVTLAGWLALLLWWAR